jgi:hypothetical protein
MPFRNGVVASALATGNCETAFSGGSVSRFYSVALAFGLALPFGQLSAQEPETTITLTVSPSFVDFGDFGGRFGAGVIRLSASRSITRLTGAEVSTFALAPLGGMSSIPGCAEGGTCRTYSTPNMLTGASGSFYVYAGESGLRLSLGGGLVRALGGEGFDKRSTVAGLVGIDWIPPSDNRFAPTLAVRFLQLSTPIAGARQLLLPGVGIRF